MPPHTEDTRTDTGLRLAGLKALALLAATVGLELPINSLWRFAVWFCVALWITSGRLRVPGRRVAAALGGAAALYAATATLPRLAIQEGHQVVLGDSRTPELDRLLPPSVRAALQREFAETYPRETWCDPATWGCWRFLPPVREAFAFSADAALQRRVRYSRIVETIEVDSLTSLRGGFVNNVTADASPTTLNWFDPATDVHRDRMPFVVWYEFDRAAVGARFCWSGTVFWPDSQGRYTEEAGQRQCRDVTDATVGRPVFASSIAQSPALTLRLEPTLGYRLFRVTRLGVRTAAVVLLAVLLVAPTRRTWRNAALAASAFLVVWGAGLLDDYLFSVQTGGGDGLIHVGFGRSILYHLTHGHWWSALGGSERVFYFMPGLRYLKAVGLLIFGETNLIDLLVLLLLPVAWYTFVQALTGRASWALGATLASLLVLPDYVAIGTVYPEAMGTLLFVGALGSLQWSSNAPASTSRIAAGISLLVLSFLVRPNVGLALVLAFAVVAARLVRQRRLAALAVATLLLSPMGLLAVHNWMYGRTLVLMTSAATVPGNLRVSPRAYLAATSDAPSRSAVATHLVAGLQTPSGIVSSLVMQRARLSQTDGALALQALAWTIVRCLAVLGLAAGAVRASRRLDQEAVGVAVSAGLLLPLLVYTNTGRWVLLPWSVALIVSAHHLARAWSDTLRPRGQHKELPDDVGPVRHA